MHIFVLVATLMSLFTAQAYKRFPLDSAAGLRLNNVTAEPATLEGKRGVKVAMAAPALKRLQSMTSEQQAAAAKTGDSVEQLALVEGLAFGNGTIEVELAGTADTSVFKDARGFVGIAFRVQADLRTYDAFYLRPTNGRAEDQIRRNHSAQYISHPAWPWFRLRTEAPEKYESYVDLVPGAWTQLKIDVKAAQARLYVHGQAQPTLIVNDLKTGSTASGSVALWLDIGTTAYFRNLTVTPTN